MFMDTSRVQVEKEQVMDVSKIQVSEELFRGNGKNHDNANCLIVSYGCQVGSSLVVGVSYVENLEKAFVRNI